MSSVTAIDPPRPIRSQMRDALMARITAGSIEPGRSLRPTELARKFGVSPTPLREALIELVRDGFLDNEPNRGFFVRPLSTKEAGELYPLIGQLEVLALASVRPTPEQLATLDRINERFAAAAGSERRVTLDTRWHEALLGNCTNTTLHEVLRGLRGRVRRYEEIYMREVGASPTSARQHRGVVRALRRGDLRSARELLDRNWCQGADVLVPWLTDFLARD
jgi:DNA-binding GntR family transcriptional regulator